jgi:hypothetical protein
MTQVSPLQQSEVEVHTPPFGTHWEPHRSTPMLSGRQGAPLQHCDENEQICPSGMQAPCELQRGTPALSNLQQPIFGGMQSQQSWRELPQVLSPMARPHTSPSGSHPSGLWQVPTGGFELGIRSQVTELAPGSPVAPPPQQSSSLVQVSPITRQPLAGMQARPPVLVGAHTRLQQLVHPWHGSPSTVQPPDPVDMSTPQVPAFDPMTRLHTPVQQSVETKQISPVALQPAPTSAHLPPWQFIEQQSLDWAQVSPSVVQPPVTSAAHLPPLQFWLQQSAAAEQPPPSGVHTEPAQVPAVQARLQQSVALVHAPPFGAHTLMLKTHWPLGASHRSEQH